MLIVLVTTFLISVGISVVILPQLIGFAKRKNLYDLPNSRKVHKIPIPRIGGLAFLPTILISCAAIMVLTSRFTDSYADCWPGDFPQHFMAYVAGALMLYFTGMYDDILGTSYRVKFLVQLVAASLLCVSGLWFADMHGALFLHHIPFWVGMPLTLLVVVYVTNAINLIDGIDGLASGLSMISLLVMGGICLMQGEVLRALIALSMIGAIAVFFYFNVIDAKRKVFMGDAGSLTIGYTISFLLLHFWQIESSDSIMPARMAVVAAGTLVIPCFDVIRVFASRIRDGRNPFLPDKNHIHHKLLRSGMGPHMTMLTILLMSVFVLTMNYLLSAVTVVNVIVIADIIMYVLMHKFINVFIFRREKKTGKKWDRELKVEGSEQSE